MKKSFPFPKEARLCNKREFEAVFQNNVKGVTRGLVVYLKANDRGLNRLGLVVGKKNGNAVRRNRIRRLLREVFRMETPTLPQGYDLVCIPRIQAFPKSCAQLFPVFRHTVKKAMERNGER